jgi:protein TonB
MYEYDIDDEDEGFFRRHRTGIVAAGVVVLCAGVFVAARYLSNANQEPIRHDELIMAVIPTPPVPKATPKPTPTPDTTPPPDEKEQMIVQNPVVTAPKPPPKISAPALPGPIGTSIGGPGADGFGLTGGIGGSGGADDGNGVGGSKYGWYASEIQNRIADVVRNDARARRQTISVIARIWPDSTGRIARAKVTGGGGSAFETAVQNDILTGLQLPDPPPADMPLPIVMRLTVAESR